jgi:hypothetical protein
MLFSFFYSSMKKILIILLLSFSFSSFASFDFNTNCKSAYEKIISLRFNEGKILLDNEKKDNPSNLIPYYIENYIDFLKLIISEDATLFNTLKDNKDTRISKIEDADDDSPYYRYCLAEIYLQWAFARIKFKEYITAAGEMNKAYKLLSANEEKYTDFIPNHKGLGILHALIGTIPDDYKWTTKLIGVSGTISQGVSELTSVLATALKNDDYSYLKTESVFFLAFIQLNFQSNKDEAIKLGKYLNDPTYIALVKDNPLLTYAAANIALRTGANDKAIEILLARPLGEEYYPFYYLDYITGVAKLNRLDDDSYKYLYSFITNFKGQNYIKAAYQKLAWYYLINNNTTKYKEKIAYALTLGSNFVDEDSQALTEAKSNSVPNIPLLKARLLFDGGYYQKAIDMMIEKKPSDFCTTTKDYLEYTYRLGRIYDEWGSDSKAIPFYELTIKNGSALTYYFAANSSLHLGMIYENLKNKEKAKYYYELCSTMKNTEYKSSINQKAKAGLNRLQ